MILLLTIPHEQESRFDTDRPYKERNEVNMIHLGDITKIHGNEIEPVDCIQLSLFGRTCPEPFPATTERTSGQCWKNLPALDKQTLLFLDLRGGQMEQSRSNRRKRMVFGVATAGQSIFRSGPA